MSYDLAVWVGDLPQTDAAAGAQYAELMDRMEVGHEEREPEPVSDRIRVYVDALLNRWPDITEDEGENSPWADGPLINNAFGNCIYFAMVWSRAEEASEFAAQVAAKHGLVCYDPQSETLRPPVGNSPPLPPDDPKRRRGWRGLFGRS